MHIAERVLLYAVAVVFGVWLFVGGPAVTAEGVPAAGPAESAADVANQHGVGVAAERRVAQAATLQPAPGDGVSRKSLSLVDAQGRPRLELTVADDGHPSINLKDDHGQTIIRLEATRAGGGRIALNHEQMTARLEAGSPDSLALELRHESGAGVRVALTAAGETELSSRSMPGGVEAVLRTAADGSADIRVGSAGDGPVASLSALADGHLELRMTGKSDAPGPAMQLFNDGLSQIVLAGPGSESGPSLIRFPNGVSVVAVRRDDGQPGASMVASPDGASVVAAIAKGRREQAELRINAAGHASFGIVEPEQQPARPDPPEQAPEQPPEKPGKKVLLGVDVAANVR